MLCYSIERARGSRAMASLRAKTLDFGGFDSSLIVSLFKGWNSHVQVQREFSGNVE